MKLQPQKSEENLIQLGEVVDLVVGPFFDLFWETTCFWVEFWMSNQAFEHLCIFISLLVKYIPYQDYFQPYEAGLVS